MASAVPAEVDSVKILAEAGSLKIVACEAHVPEVQVHANEGQQEDPPSTMQVVGRRAASMASVAASPGASGLANWLGAQKQLRGEKQDGVPDSDGQSPIAFMAGETHMSASNGKGATWKQILKTAKDFELPGSTIQQQFAEFKGWLESPWRANAAKAKAAPPAKKPRTEGGSVARSGPSLTSPQGHEPALRASPAAAGAAATIPPGALNQLARLVASHVAPALQNGGVGDQLPGALGDTLQRIEANQSRLVELAVTEYIRSNEASVRAAAVKKYLKAKKRDADFVAEAKAAYAEKNEDAVRAEAAERYMSKHKDDEEFQEEAADAYIEKYKTCEKLLEAAAEKYKDEHWNDDEFVQEAEQKYIDEHEDDIREEAAERYKDEHWDDDEFVQEAEQKYIYEHEDEIKEEAAERYKNEHEDDKAFVAAAKRLWSDENM